MDSNNRRQPEQPPLDGDWRLQLPNDSRQMIVNDIMDTLNLRKIAIRLEEKIYHAATSQSDYHRRIRLKMLRMESSSNPHGAMPNAVPSSSTCVGRNSGDPDSWDSTASTNNSESQEEVYQKIKVMKDLYYLEIHEIHQKLCSKIQQHESESHHAKSFPIEKLQYFKEMVGRVLQCLQMSRSAAIHFHKDKLPGLEKQILGITRSYRPIKPEQPLQQEQFQLHENGVNSQLQ